MITATQLAALAAASTLRLTPREVVGPVGRPDGHYDTALLVDELGRRWMIRHPRDGAAAGLLGASAGLAELLKKNTDVPVPLVTGWATTAEGYQASIHPHISGMHLELGALSASTQLSAAVGQAIADIHNVSLGLSDEAGLASYSAEDVRRRKLTLIDRGAATGLVPAPLLTRWEKALENPSLWQFAPTLVHSSLGSHRFIVQFEDAETGTIAAITGWEAAHVGDPADDLAVLMQEVPVDAHDTVLEAYAGAREVRPDSALLHRARLAAEMASLEEILAATRARETGDEYAQERIDQAANWVESLADRIAAEESAEAQRKAAEQARASAAAGASMQAAPGEADEYTDANYSDADYSAEEYPADGDPVDEYATDEYATGEYSADQHYPADYPPVEYPAEYEAGAPDGTTSFNDADPGAAVHRATAEPTTGPSIDHFDVGRPARPIVEELATPAAPAAAAAGPQKFDSPVFEAVALDAPELAIAEPADAEGDAESTAEPANVANAQEVDEPNAHSDDAFTESQEPLAEGPGDDNDAVESITDSSQEGPVEGVQAAQDDQFEGLLRLPGQGR